LPGKETYIPLKNILLSQDTAIIKEYIDIMLRDDIDIPVECFNKSTSKKRKMPFKVMYNNNPAFWKKPGDWEYSVSSIDLDKVKSKLAVRPGGWEKELPQKTETQVSHPNAKIEKTGFGDKYSDIAAMSAEEKLNHLNRQKSKLNDLYAKRIKDEKVITKALVESTSDAAVINHIALEEAMRMGDDEAKKQTQELVDSTHEMVKSSSHLFSQDVFNDELMNELVKKSNGTIVQHMTRVFLNGIAFMSYYNKLVSSSSAINKIRISFMDKYREFYHSLMPHIPIRNFTLERVFYKGMMAIPPDLFHKWGVGFLIHDIGKAAAVEYHEGEAEYDRNVVIEHVKLGYKSIMNKTNYPIEASLITGYHHEYYGDSSGYGYFRAYLEQYRKEYPDSRLEYCMTYDLEPILGYKALAYFPAKVLEVIDVYDSVTDPNRVYREPMKPQDALAMMRREFIENKRKIDPIIFDIFEAFIMDKLGKAAVS